MINIKPHRNSQKRDYTNNNVYFIVTKTHNNIPYFKEPIFCELLIEDLKLCKKLKEFKLYGFSIIYDHLNLMIHPNDEFNISKIMKSLKENVSRNINYVIFGFPKKCDTISNKGDTISNEGDTTSCRLQKRKSIYSSRNQFIKKYGHNQIIIPKFKWKKSYHDHIIRNVKDFENHYHYTIYNFQKHNLPANWKYTSLNYGEIVNEIEL